MDPIRISAADDRDLVAFLEDRIYEFNVAATGYADGELLSAAVRDAAGAIVAGISGHTWGGVCTILLLWVHDSRRGRGLGSALLRAAEAEARRRGCVRMVLSTHSFQAPGFYQGEGYEHQSTLDDYPLGHAQIVYAKTLAPHA